MVRGWTGAVLALLLGGLCSHAAADEFWVDGRRQPYAWLSSATQPWRICALLPQGQDRFWWGVSWGLAEQGKLLGVKLGIFVAAGYGDAAGQRQQWQACKAQGAQAFIVSTTDAGSLQDEIRQAMAEGLPVIDLLNGVQGRATSSASGHVGDMIDQLLDVMLKDAGGKPVTVAWFPGPEHSVWADLADAAVQRRLRHLPGITLNMGGYGSTDMKTQATLVRAYLHQFGEPDYLVGNAVAVEFAARYWQGQPHRSKLLAFYGNEGVVERIVSHEVMATVNNQPVLQARLAVDLAVRALQRMRLPARVAPTNLLLDERHLGLPYSANMLAPEGQRLVRQDLR